MSHHHTYYANINLVATARACQARSASCEVVDEAGEVGAAAEAAGDAGGRGRL